MTTKKYNREHRLLSKKKGLCKSHKGAPVVPGKTKCQACLDYEKSYRDERKKDGWCPNHSRQKLVGGKQSCYKCANYLKEYHKNKIDARVCPTCPISLRSVIEPGTKRCKDCLIENRVRNLKYRGLPEEELQKAKKAMQSFDNICQCCGVGEVEARGWHSDHDHETNLFRGIICFSCNVGLGSAKDDPVVLEKMAAYVRKSRS